MTWAGLGSEYKKENCTVVRQKDIYDNDLESWFIPSPEQMYTSIIVQKKLDLQRSKRF